MSQVFPLEEFGGEEAPPAAAAPQGGGAEPGPGASPRGRKESQKNVLGHEEEEDDAADEEPPGGTNDNWFFHPEKFPEQKRKLGVLGDVRYGIFGDMLHNSHRNRLLGMFMFGFCVAFVVLWLAAIEYFTDDVSNFALRFEQDVPSTATIGVALAPFKVVVLDRNSLTPVREAKIDIFAFPAEPVALAASFATGVDGATDELPTRHINCLEATFLPEGTYAHQDRALCVTPIEGASLETDKKGRAIFSDLRILGGPATTVSLIIKATVPYGWWGRVDQVFVERFVSMRTPVETASVTTPVPERGVAAGVPFQVVVRAGLALPGIENATLAESAVAGMETHMLSVPVTGRDSLVEYLLPLPAVGQHRYAAYSVRSTEASVVSTDVQMGITRVTVDITIEAVVDWFIGQSHYPALFLSGKLVYVGPVLGSGLVAPLLNRPIEIAPATPAWNRTMMSALPTTVVEGVAVDGSVQYLFEPSSGGASVWNETHVPKGAILARVVSFNGTALPPYYDEAAGSAARHTTLKDVVNAVAEVSVDPRSGKAVASLNLTFTTAGLPGVYGVAFSSEDEALPVRVDDGNGAVLFKDIWEVTVASAVADASATFIDTLKLFTRNDEPVYPIDVGVPAAAMPTIVVRDAQNKSVAGKVARWVAKDPSALGLNAVSLQSDLAGTIQFAHAMVTFAKAAGQHATEFWVDDVLAAEFTLDVAINMTAIDPSLPTHVEPVSAPVGVLTPFQDAVTVEVLNALGAPLPGTAVWATLHSGEQRKPPIGFVNNNGLEWSGSSALYTTDAAGRASIRMDSVGFPAPVAVSFAFQGMHAESAYPATVGGVFLKMANAYSSDGALSATAVTAVDLGNGDWRIEAANAETPVVVIAVQYPKRLTKVLQKPRPTSGWTPQHRANVTLSGREAPGEYRFAVYGGGTWGTWQGNGVSAAAPEIFAVTIDTPVRSLEIERPTVARGETVDAGGFVTLPSEITKHVPEGAPFLQMPRIVAKDASGNPVPGVVVTAVLNNPTADPAQTFLYAPESMVETGVLADLIAVTSEDVNQTVASIAATVSQVTIPDRFPGVDVSGLRDDPLGAALDARTLAEQTVESGASRLYDSVTAEAIRSLGDLPVTFPVSQVSGADGVCTFTALGVVNPPGAFRISYVYLHKDELAAVPNGVVVTENKARATDMHHRGILLTPPAPVASVGQAFSAPVTVGLVDANYDLLSYTFAAVAAAASDPASGIQGHLSTAPDAVLKSVGPLVLPNLQFRAPTEFGSYRLRFVMPGAVLESTGVAVSRDPHVLEILEGPPAKLLVGSSFRVKVAAKLGDGSGVAGVNIKARLKLAEQAEVFAATADMTYTAVTDEAGVATFYISHGAGKREDYVLQFTANRGVSSFFAASSALIDAANSYADRDLGATAMTTGLSHVPPEYKGYLEQRMASSAATLGEYAFQQVVQEYEQIQLDSDPFRIYNGVQEVQIVRQPVLDIPDSSPLDLGAKGVFTTVPIVKVIGTNGLPLPNRRVTPVLQGEAVGGASLSWRASDTTQADGMLEFTALKVVNATGPRVFQIVFICEGEPSNASDPVELMDRIDVTKIGNVYLKALTVVVLIMPWLFANTPDAAPTWTWFSFALSASMPYMITLIIPGLFSTRVLFVQLSMWFTVALWAAVTLGLLWMTIESMTKNVGQNRKLRNDYRYVRWLSALIPFSTEEEILEYRNNVAVNALGIWDYICFKFYSGYLAVFYPKVNLSLVGRRDQYRWTTLCRPSLSRNPCTYRQHSTALQYEYGVFFHVPKIGTLSRFFDNEVTCRLVGCDRRYAESRRDDIEQRLNALTGMTIEELRVHRDTSIGQTATLVFLISETDENREVIDKAVREHGQEKGLERYLEKKVSAQEMFPNRVAAAKKCLPIMIDKVDVVPSADRRMNDSEWTFRDTLKVRLHFGCVPVLLEEGRKMREDRDEEEEVEEEDGAPSEQKFYGRVWVKHVMPDGIRRSNGQPFPEFWSPSHDENCMLMLTENDTRDFNSPPLDNIKEVHGGRPSDITEPIYYPFRFLVAAATCFVLIVYITLFTFYLYEGLVMRLQLFLGYVPKPAEDMTPVEVAEFNASTQRYLAFILTRIADSHARFEFVRELIPRIEDVDFVAAWHWLYDVLGELIDAMTIAAAIALIVAALVSLVHWCMMLKAVPVYLKEIRRGMSREPDLKARSECYVADRYVGTQAFHVTVSFVIVYSLIFLVGVVVFQPRLLPWFLKTYWPEILTMILTALAGVFIELVIIRFFVTSKYTVKHPRVYAKWQLCALVIHIVGGLVITLVRWVKSVAFQTLLFARLDLMLFPGSFNKLDQGYWSFWAMLFTDEAHNNPILRVFVSMLLTDHYIESSEFSSQDATRKAGEGEDDPAAPPKSPRQVAAARRQKEAQPESETPTVLLRLVPTMQRQDLGEAEPTEVKSCVENLKVYVDSEMVSTTGRQLRRANATEMTTGNVPDLRFFRSPHPAVGPTKVGEGCHRCGSHDMTEFYAPAGNDIVGAQFLRVVYPIAVEPDSDADSDDEAQVEWVDWRGEVDPVNSSPVSHVEVAAGYSNRVPPVANRELNGAWVTQLKGPANVVGYKLTPYVPTVETQESGQASSGGLGASAGMVSAESEGKLGGLMGGLKKGAKAAFGGLAKKKKPKPSVASELNPALGGVKKTGGDPDATPPLPKTWLLLGSHDGHMWSVVDEKECVEEQKPDTVHTTRARRGTLAVCISCYERRQPEEGAMRRLVEVEARACQPCDAGAGLLDSLFYEVTMPSARAALRGYSIQTSTSADPKTDMLSWAFAAAETTHEEYKEKPEAVVWRVYHDAVHAPMPTVRGMHTPIFGCWPSPATKLDFRKTFLHDHTEQSLPFMRGLMQVRYRHILGQEGKVLMERMGTTDQLLSQRTVRVLAKLKKIKKSFPGLRQLQAKDPEEEKKEAVEMTRFSGRNGLNLNGVYTSLLERSAFRNMQCRKSLWWTAFMLVMNPSLLETRKSVRREMRLSVDQLKLNTAYLRERIALEKWRIGDSKPPEVRRRSVKALKRSRSSKARCEHAAPAIRYSKGPVKGYSVTCQSPLLAGTYTERETVKVRSFHAVPDKTRVEVRGEQVTLIISAHLGTVDLTEKVAALLKNGELDFPFAASGGLDVSSYTGAAFELGSESAKKAEDRLSITYVSATFRRDSTTPHPMRGVTTEMCAESPGSMHYQNGSWWIGVPAPAPGFQYSFLVSDPVPTATRPDGALKWHWWDAGAVEWKEDATVAVREAA
eukprot:TRINITY_DN11101_c0_g1_i1.p1 TRINITY_DN11101_c0_g1~~TRINITY_DN11101_c0_g1_i1.p1  ORF type:complete len:3299 (+),score=1196.02 TRINITY_DN11101_c0_g1_i1:151-9897(+)